MIAERLRPWQRVSPRRLVDGLPELPAVASSSRAARDGVEEPLGGDPLRQVAPAVYVPALTGRAIGRDNKIACPFHGEDRVPSLHVYDTPERGWYCFGCGRGGSIFDLAGELYGLSTRGPHFLELRQRLLDTLTALAPESPGGEVARRGGERRA